MRNTHRERKTPWLMILVIVALAAVAIGLGVLLLSGCRTAAPGRLSPSNDIAAQAPRAVHQ